MGFDESQQGSAIVITFKGQLLGGETAQDFKARIKDLVKEGRKEIVLDLTKVTYINSSGIGMLVAGLATVSQSGGKLKLAGIEENIHNVFAITNLVSVFDCYKTVDEAISAYS